jgi:hypothetical protein
MHTLTDVAARLATLKRDPAAPTPPQNINSHALFAALLNNELRAQAGQEAHALADRVIEGYFEAVLSCRRSELAVAHDQLCHADSLMPMLPAPTVDYVTLFRLSAWGNYHYKAGAGPTAIALLQQGLAISADLERRGYYPFIYRRIEQLQNIAAIYFKQHDYEAAHALLKATLRFVHGGPAQGLLINDWDTAAISRVRPLQENTLQALFHQLATNNTQYLSHVAYDNAYYYRVYFKDLLQEMEADTYNRIVCYNWLYTKVSYFAEGFEAFLSNMLEFLSDPDIVPAYDFLKANLLAQVIHETARLGQQPGRHELLEVIQQFAANNLTASAGNLLRKMVLA